MLAQWLERSGQIYRDHTAIALGKRAYMSYGDLAERAAKFAMASKELLDLDKGDRVAIFATNCPEFLEILYGIWHAGLAAVPINNKLHPREVQDILDDSGAKICFISEDLYGKWSINKPETCELKVIGDDDYDDLFLGAPALIHQPDLDEMAWLFYTSGTTGKPKGAMLSYRNLMAMCNGYHADVDKVLPGESIIHAAPMSHGSGLYALPQVAMGAVNVIPESGGFDPKEIEELYQFWREATMFAAPTMVSRMVTANLNPYGLKKIVYGGGPMYLDDAIKARDMFPGRLTQIYGQGESPMSITVLPTTIIEDTQHPQWEERLASVGFSNQSVEVMIGDEDGNPVELDETGEIMVRGEAVMLGYWQNPEATAKTIRDGWLFTGDMGAMNEQGFITLKDRSKDVIISGGSNIYPREVEEVLLSHPNVSEVSVIARVDPDWGEVPIAYVVGDVQDSDLDQLCLENMARFKRPKAYIHLEALPKNNYGKILKTELRKMDQIA
ncbi:class I adenylate-forming enzyme family protein [Curvivirga aplysinae]|uniref:class I adenylate-forming enzyme family protein n=1 Tax=Curvivirga aplysinae TaxID=2529852 RepID=UPI0012BD23DE|nr:AMP-binding protein [Curvivirga aplysinae]